MTEEREVSTWYLEMRSPSELVPSRVPAWEHRFERVQRPNAAFARYLYTHVGGDWHWTDRLGWSKARWDAHLVREAVELHTLQLGGAPAGYVELERQADGNVLIAYLGLIDAATGKGFGGMLTTYAVRRAWSIPKTERVWVHTCSLDSPRALPSYRARGFSVYRTETKTLKLLPSAGPWTGWNCDLAT
jgi:GNAT superfamily N-acetyltransferase